MSSIKAVVFDLDGLMVDSEPVSRQAWEQVLQGYGRTLDDVTYTRMVGLRMDDTIQLVAETFGLAAVVADLAEQKQETMAVLRAKGIPVMPGLMRLVGELEKQSLPWGVATSSRRAYAEEILAQLGLLAACRALATGDEVRRGKPAPDLYLLAAGRLGVAPADCLALEDSVPGGRAAMAAGMVLAAVPGGHATPADFHFAHHVFRSLDEVAASLDQVLRRP